MKYMLIATATTILSALPLAGFAASEHADHQMMHTSAAADMQMVDGSVKKVDKSAGKVTLSHGPLINLGMPAMTMVYRVQDARWLDQLKEGDKIRFMADNSNGVFTIVHFEPAK